MKKRLFLIAVLCVGLMFIWGTAEVKAWPRISGWGLSCPDTDGDGLPNCSVYVNAYMLGLGNPEVNAVYVDATLSDIHLEALCQNNGGGTGGDGWPFVEVIGSTSETTEIGWKDFISKGKAVANLYFNDCEFYELIKDVDGICQNDNWSIIPPSEYEAWVDGGRMDEDCVEDNTGGGTFTVTSTFVEITVRDESGDVYYAEGSCTLNRDDPLDVKYECIPGPSGRL